MEALALTGDDLQGDRVSIVRALTDGVEKETKTGDQRIATLPRQVAADLRSWQLLSGARNGLLWTRQTDGRPWRQTDWDNWRERWWYRASSFAGMGNYRPYDLRHTAASLRIASGRPITEVAAELGHSPHTCARSYAHVVDSFRGRPVVPIEDWIDRARRDEPESSTNLVRSAFGGLG
jgi:integrase